MLHPATFSTPESERRLREFWAYSGDLFLLTDSEWQFVTTIVREAPALRRVEESLDWSHQTVSIGQLHDWLREGPIERRIMIATLLAYGTHPAFLWLGCGGPLLGFLPHVGPENLNALSTALRGLVDARTPSTGSVPKQASNRRRKGQK